MKIPKEAQELSNKASEHIDNKEFEKALKYLNQALEIEPNYAEVMSKLGYIHYKLDYKKMSKEEVFNLSKKALDLNPKSPIVWRYMGIAYDDIKEYDKAIECYEKVVKIGLNPDISKKVTDLLKNVRIIDRVKKTVLDLGTKFAKLQIAEISEVCAIKEEQLIIDVIKDMINNREIYAQYFSSTKSVAFNQQANIEEIDKLMATYKKWEDKEFGKK